MRKGTKHRPESLAILSEKAKARVGRPVSKATRDKMSEIQKKLARDRAELVRETIRTIAEVKRVLADAKAEDAQAVAGE